MSKETTAIQNPDRNTGIQIFDYGEDAGKGYENQSKADLSMPFINLLQGLSPLVKDGKARAGDFYNTVTQQIWPRETGLLFVPGSTKQMFAEWVPRKQGGGFRGHHQVNDEVVLNAIKNAAKFGKYLTPEGNNLNDTFYVYGALCTEDGIADSMCVIPFWSTKIRPYKAWNSRLRTFNMQHGNKIPLYANLVRLTSKETKNSEGDFFIPELTSADPRGIGYSLLGPDDERFQMAKACAQLVMSGDADINYGKSREAEGDDEDGEKKDGNPF
jgi:hypothetical protein